MFSKCANPEDGGGVKRIIMGLDRHTRYGYRLLPIRSKFSLTPFPSVQDALRLLFRRILYARRSTGEHAIHIRHKTRRADNSLRLGSWLQGRKAVRTGKERRPGMQTPVFLSRMHYMTRHLRCETSIGKTMTLEEEDGVPRHRDWRLKGGARRSKNAMQMWSRVLQWPSVVESGSTHSHLQNHLISVVGHPMTTMMTTALDSAPELMKIPDGCSFLLTSLYFCILLLCHAAFSLMSMSCDHFICPCSKCHSQ